MEKGLLIHPEELSKKWIDRAANLGIETLGIHPWGGKRAEASLYELVEQVKTDEFRALVDYAKECGLNVEYEMHAGSWLLPRNLFETHPEYFRVDDTGVRTAKRNFCITNPDAMNYVLERSKELAAALYGSGDRYYFWLDDGRRYRCNCENCAPYTSSDQLLLVVNAMARELRKGNPNAKVAYLAFYETLKLPQTVKPEEGVFLEYAPIERKFDRPVWEMPEEEIEKLKALLDFFGRKDAKVLEYWFDNSLFSKWTKPPIRYSPNNDLIRADVEYYHKLGFENISSFACFLGQDYEELFGEPDVSAFQK